MRKKLVIYSCILIVFLLNIFLYYKSNYNVLKGEKIKSEINRVFKEFICENYELNDDNYNPKIPNILILKERKLYKYCDDKIKFSISISPISEKMEYLCIIENNIEHSIAFNFDNLNEFILDNKYLKKRFRNEYNKFSIEDKDNSFVISSTRRIKGKRVYFNHNGKYPDRFELNISKVTKKLKYLIIPDSIVIKPITKSLPNDNDILDSFMDTIESKYFSISRESIKILKKDDDKLYFTFNPFFGLGYRKYEKRIVKLKSEYNYRSKQPNLATDVYIESESSIIVFDVYKFKTIFLEF